MQDLNWLGAAKLSRGYARKKFSPVDVTRACLAQIAKHDHAINAMCRVKEKEALEQAKASAARWKKGEALGPLDGVPVLVKDLLLVKGWPTLRGSKPLSAIRRGTRTRHRWRGCGKRVLYSWGRQRRRNSAGRA